ncbi:DUF4331 family protein [Aequorivita antarctica]|uniref:DUF4331 domain-containing protein n=1 Tax=Aequorivita antarctica TaxID=153266 RepID=A0A5C6Z3B5_9FLAO|nr:DUF4331 family protein [Aequorivita antarctica]TXD74158.1 DUF4331 domain-containing protein [Aequorivita antarctica]SRX75989.1 hypothetical protein AEQU3_02987 [Aequorivita antarctica]
MKTFKYITLFAAITTSLLFVQCKDEDDNVIINATCSDGILNGNETGIDCGGTACLPCGEVLDFSGTYIQEDQMGRPGINTVFGSTGFKDAFNVTVPSEMQAAFQSKFQTNLLTLNAGYTTNALGLNAEVFTTVLSNDVLWLAQTGITTYFNGTEILTGRALSDDVIDVSLLLIFGGPDGTENPTLTSDGVPANDVAFSSTFPYMVGPF